MSKSKGVGEEANFSTSRSYYPCSSKCDNERHISNRCWSFASCCYDLPFCLPCARQLTTKGCVWYLPDTAAAVQADSIQFTASTDTCWMTLDSWLHPCHCLGQNDCDQSTTQSLHLSTAYHPSAIAIFTTWLISTPLQPSITLQDFWYIASSTLPSAQPSNKMNPPAWDVCHAAHWAFSQHKA